MGGPELQWIDPAGVFWRDLWAYPFTADSTLLVFLDERGT